LLGLAAGEDIEVVTIHRDGAVAERTSPWWSWWARSPVHCRRSTWLRRSTWTGRHGSRGGGRHAAERRSAVSAEWRSPKGAVPACDDEHVGSRCAHDSATVAAHDVRRDQRR
jgi:hypothetical protein